jgi:penicillin amidase
VTVSIDAAALAAALPAVSGDLKIPGLAAKVTVHRDAWGIPHIKAVTEADAYFALGFVHAQDRLFQMELTRRRALGRAAEWLGAEAAESDILVRRLGMEAACRRDHAALGQDAQAMLASYTAGVNAFISSGAPQAIEYTLLETAPEPWEPWHSIAVMRRLGLLMGSVWFKLWRMLALPIVGAAETAGLRYDDGGKDLLTIPTGATADRWQADLAALAPSVKSLLLAMGSETGGDETGGGSNNWAVGPAQSATGRPVLAGDPHRVFEIPGMYTQHHLACDRFDMIGLTVPGVPGFPHFGHNDHVAYGVTHAFMDIHDLFVEQFDATGTRARIAETWEPVTIRSDSIDVRGGETRHFDIVATRNGPVIAGDPKSGAALALRSVQFAETDLSFDCLPRMVRSRTVAELFANSEGWGLIDHNLVAGDVDGQIGHLVRARVPRRPREAGWLPMPGWTHDHDWQGWIPHSEMPCVIDPPAGIIVTANNRVVDDSFPHYLSTDCHPPYRAARILELLTERAPFGPKDAAAIHADVFSANALLVQKSLGAVADPIDPRAVALRHEILAWNGRMESGSRAAGLYIALRRAMTSTMADRSGLSGATSHDWAAVSPGVSPQGQLWWTLPTKLRQNDTGLLAGWSWDQLISHSLAQIASSQDQKTWGETHQPRFTHPLSTAYPGAAALLDPASEPVGGDTDTVMAIGLACAAGPTATYGALSRYVFDVGNWNDCEWIVFQGASGHPGSPHYTDQVAPWSACLMVPMLYDWNRIAAEAETTQHLT